VVDREWCAPDVKIVKGCDFTQNRLRAILSIAAIYRQEGHGSIGLLLCVLEQPKQKVKTRLWYCTDLALPAHLPTATLVAP